MFNKSYNVKLEIFEGPMDLLLHLIKKNEVDVYDIPITLITEQYLEYVEAYKSLNLEMAGEYLVMAANLIHIKSKMLLPIPEEEDEEDDGLDPRAELVRRLIEYKRFKEVAEALAEKNILGRDVFTRGFPFPLDNLEESREENQLDLALMDLIEAFKEVLKQAPEELKMSFSVDKFHVVDKINGIMERINNEKTTDFFSLFPDGASRGEIIVTFLAILELCKRVMIKVSQRDANGGITLYLPDQLVADAEGNLPKEIEAEVKSEMAENVVEAVKHDLSDVEEYGGSKVGYDEDVEEVPDLRDTDDDLDLDELNRELDAESVNQEEVEAREKAEAKAEAEAKRVEIQKQISEAKAEAEEKELEELIKAEEEAKELEASSQGVEKDEEDSQVESSDENDDDESDEEPPPHLKDDPDDQADQGQLASDENVEEDGEEYDEDEAMSEVVDEAPEEDLEDYRDDNSDGQTIEDIVGEDVEYATAENDNGDDDTTLIDNEEENIEDQISDDNLNKPQDYDEEDEIEEEEVKAEENIEEKVVEEDSALKTEIANEKRTEVQEQITEARTEIADEKRTEVREQVTEARTEVADEKRKDVQEQVTEARTEVADEKRHEIRGQIKEARIEASPLSLVKDDSSVEPEEEVKNEEALIGGPKAGQKKPTAEQKPRGLKKFFKAVTNTVKKFFGIFGRKKA